MQAVVWSPQLSNIIKSLKVSKTEIASDFSRTRLSQEEEKAISSVLLEKSQRKNELQSPWN
jgi:hypothetical protein